MELKHLKVFGSATFVHQKGDNLDPKSKKFVFIGYPGEIRGCKLWDKSEPGFKVIASRDVVFNESDFRYLFIPTIVSSEVEPHLIYPILILYLLLM